MPFTEKFLKIKRKYKRRYDDEAKVLTFSFEEAFKYKIPTFRNKKLNFKHNIHAR